MCLSKESLVALIELSNLRWRVSCFSSEAFWFARTFNSSLWTDSSSSSGRYGSVAGSLALTRSAIIATGVCFPGSKMTVKVFLVIQKLVGRTSPGCWLLIVLTS